MELKRKVYDKLLNWKKNSNGSTAILVEGARRIGKSTIVKKFAEENYKSYILIDFSNVSNTIKDNFDENLINLDKFFQTISLEYQTRLYKRESVIIFDEVQLFPKARQAIKHLVFDGRYDFIETGSLISLKENVENILIPSEEEKLKMYPLDFEEFLWATDNEMLSEYIEDCFINETPLKDAFHKRALYAFNEYILVGGMPQSVVAYCSNNKDFFEADKQKRMILNLYKDDIKKSSAKYESKVSVLFDNIPGFLSKHEKKISLRSIDKGSSYSKYDEALFWLNDSMIANLCYKCTDPSVGLSLNKDNSSVKCYMGDTGLLVSMILKNNKKEAMELYKKIMNNKVSFNFGMLYENIIAQTFASKGMDLYFYTSYNKESKKNDIEIDFLAVHNQKVVSIEVKSSKNYTTSSYVRFKNKFGKRIGDSYIIHPKAYSKDGNSYKIPAYMAHCLFKG
jgi:uncharacterized protein